MSNFFIKEGFNLGRMVSFSKSSYREKYPDNEVYFNANIFVLGEGKIWYGDVDVTKDMTSLQNIAREIGKDLYVLSEMDGRFENENLEDSEIIRRSRCKINK
jgi:hypothetical protein